MYSQLLSQANKKNISHFTINTMSLCPNTWKSYLKQIDEEIATFLLKSGILKNIQCIFTFSFATESFPPAFVCRPHNTIRKGQKSYRRAICCMLQLPVINWKFKALLVNPGASALGWWRPVPMHCLKHLESRICPKASICKELLIHSFIDVLVPTVTALASSCWAFLVYLPPHHHPKRHLKK